MSQAIYLFLFYSVKGIPNRGECISNDVGVIIIDEMSHIMIV